MTKERPRILGLVFLTVFLDLVGFSIIFPIFPRLLEHYVALEGAESAIGRLQTWLVELTGSGEGADFAVVTLFGGILGSIYSLLQFLFAPFWGSLSDRRGRRSTLLLTLLGTALSYLLWFFAGSFALLIGARVLGGIMAGNISIASAAVSDTTSGADRAKGMGIVGMAIGLGFVVGPAIGGISASWNLLDPWPAGADLGVNPFSGPALIAFALASLNWIWALRRFPETLSEETRGNASEGRTLHPFRALRSIGFPGVMRTNLISFLYLSAFSGMEFTLTFLAAERHGFGPRDNMWMFVFIGLVIAFVQGGVVRRVVPRVGERKVAAVGSISDRGRQSRTSPQVTRIRSRPPRYSPTTNSHVRKTAMTKPSSTTRLVEASRKASDGTKPAPFRNRARVVASAAKLQLLERKPNRVPSATLRGPVSPIAACMRSRVTKTRITPETP